MKINKEISGASPPKINKGKNDKRRESDENN